MLVHCEVNLRASSMNFLYRVIALKENPDTASVARLEFGRLGRRVIEGCFDGGNMTSDGGVMLIGKLDRRFGLSAGVVRVMSDPRGSTAITHCLEYMLRQRTYELVQGWEDLNNHTRLRNDVAYQSAVGRDRELASAPTLCRLEKIGTRAAAAKIHGVLVDQFIASYKVAPAEITLDFDATDCPLYGKQENRYFRRYGSSSALTPVSAASGFSTGATAAGCST